MLTAGVLLPLLQPFLLAFAGPGQRASAFDNALPKTEEMLKYKVPKTPGPKPLDLGPRDGNALKACVDGKPHCFSSSAEVFEDNDLFNADYGTTEGWLVEPFKFDKPFAEAVADVKAAIAAYPPGQRGVDGGGFKVISEQASADSAYFYVQFESLRKGYIDDMEFALGGNGICNTRTSSRLGYLDLGVNAKRFQWFAEHLGQTPGWSTTPLRSKGHEEYFALNNISDKDLTNKEGAALVSMTEKVKLADSGKFGTVGK